jgi:hypothetical protein
MPQPSIDDLLLTLQQGQSTPDQQRHLHAYITQMRVHLSAFQKVYRMLYEALRPVNTMTGDETLGLGDHEMRRGRPPYGLDDRLEFPKPPRWRMAREWDDFLGEWVENEEAPKYQPEYQPEKGVQAGKTAGRHKLTSEQRKRGASRGGKARMAKLSKEDRRSLALKGVIKRWPKTAGRWLGKWVTLGLDARWGKGGWEWPSLPLGWGATPLGIHDRLIDQSLGEWRSVIAPMMDLPGEPYRVTGWCNWVQRSAMIDKPYAYHKPSVEGLEKITELREVFSIVEAALKRICPPSRQTSIAITKNEEAAMWAIKAVVFNDPESEVNDVPNVPKGGW